MPGTVREKNSWTETLNHTPALEAFSLTRRLALFFPRMTWNKWLRSFLGSATYLTSHGRTAQSFDVLPRGPNCSSLANCGGRIRTYKKWRIQSPLACRLPTPQNAPQRSCCSISNQHDFLLINCSTSKSRRKRFYGNPEPLPTGAFFRSCRVRSNIEPKLQVPNFCSMHALRFQAAQELLVVNGTCHITESCGIDSRPAEAVGEPILCPF